MSGISVGTGATSHGALWTQQAERGIVAEVYTDWCEHGAAAIQTVRETRPDVYVKVVASLLPRQVQAEISVPTHEDRVTALAEKLAQLDAAKDVR